MKKDKLAVATIILMLFLASFNIMSNAYANTSFDPTHRHPCGMIFCHERQT